jgi:type III restriction enzyme
MLILEMKGQDSPEDATKRKFLQEWVSAVNQHGGSGVWREAILYDLGDLPPMLKQAVAG